MVHCFGYFGYMFLPPFRAHDFHGIVNYCRIQSAPPTLIVSYIISNGFVDI